MTQKSHADISKGFMILISGFITFIMIPFVNIAGGEKILIFVVTVPFHIFVSSIFTIIYFKVLVRRKVDVFYLNAYVMICVFLLVLSAILQYPYAP